MTPRLHLHVAQTIVDRGLWRRGMTVAVAVSGGRDSMTLLDLLVHTMGVHGGALLVATVDHGTRRCGEEDLAFVAREAQRRGLRHLVHRVALGEGASEQACRDARYAFFDALPVDRVALAHHAQDQVETAIAAWVRGAGLRGQRGMAWRRGRYVRPLLDVSPADLAAWGTAHGLAWRDDPTNDSRAFQRNRLRHDVLPALEAARPGATLGLARAAQHAAEDDAYLSSLANAAPFDAAQARWPRAWVADGPPPIVRRALLGHLGELRASHLDAIVASARRGRGRVRVSHAVDVVVDADWVRTVTHG